jgi:hypothetical protein
VRDAARRATKGTIGADANARSAGNLGKKAMIGMDADVHCAVLNPMTMGGSQVTGVISVGHRECTRCGMTTPKERWRDYVASINQ